MKFTIWTIIILALVVGAWHLRPSDLHLPDNDTVCTTEYMPVCGEREVQCITAPCYPVPETFANACEAEHADARVLFEGTCEDSSVHLVRVGEAVNLVTVTTPLYNSTAGSPIKVTGTAPGYRFFEGSAPLVLTDRDGLIIAEGYITAQEEWMTEEIIPFAGEINYELAEDIYANNGTLILQKANASGLPENDAAVELTVMLD